MLYSFKSQKSKVKSQKLQILKYESRKSKVENLKFKIQVQKFTCRKGMSESRMNGIKGISRIFSEP